MTDIAILISGGTLDKIHDTYTESLTFPENEQSQMPELLQIARCHYPRIVPIFFEDSLDIDDTHRSKLLSAAKSAPENNIVITHGTGTMDKTAQFLDGQIPEKTIVLTGAMRPFSLGKSDAGFNVGGALIAAQTLPAGVYAVMNGRIFKAAEIKKDVKAGRFDL